MQAFEIIITKLEPRPDQNSSPEEEQTELTNEKSVDDLQIVVPEMPQWAVKGEEEENADDTQEQSVVPEPAEEPVHIEVGPVIEVEEDPAPDEVPKESKVEEPNMQTVHQVKFSDSLILTSFKSPPLTDEKREQPPIKPILKPVTSKTESSPPKCDEPKVTPAPQKRETPALDRKVAGKPPLVKPPPVRPVEVVGEMKTEEKVEEKQTDEAKIAKEKTQEPPKLEPAT